MKKYTKLIIVGLLTVILITLNAKLSYAKKDIDYINEIVKLSNGNVEECGLKESVPLVEEHSSDISKEIKEKLCLEILEEYKKNLKDSLDITVHKSDLLYCIVFENNTVHGYIQISSVNDLGALTFKVQLKTEKNELTDLESQARKIIKLVTEKNYLNIDEKKVKISSYVKAKLSDVNISTVNDEIIRYLKKQKAKNIDTVKIDNGFSIVAYTESYDRINNANFDLNCMINDYMHGSYLIVGTPVIDVDFEQ